MVKVADARKVSVDELLAEVNEKADPRLEMARRVNCAQNVHLWDYVNEKPAPGLGRAWGISNRCRYCRRVKPYPR